LFSLQQNQIQENRIGSAQQQGAGGGGGAVEVAQTMYTHVSKCKNDKIFKKNKKEKLPNI
jgi:hypothetical protein